MTASVDDMGVGLKVHFDGQIFIDQVTGGISRYYTNLAMDLNAISGVEARIIAPLHRNEHLSAETRAPVIGIGVPPSWRAGRICWMTQRTIAPLISRIANPDIVHETYFSPDPPLKKSRRRVATVLDMIHELYFPGSLTAEHKKAAIARCDHVVCISHNTKKDLCEILGFPEDRASVTHLAYEDFSAYIGAINRPLERPYFLYVGNRDGYKNFETFLKAYASSDNLRKNFGVVCFGGGSFKEAEIQLVEELGLTPEQVVHAGGDDSALGAAYAGAEAFVYPSKYEGFGIPPLEAMSAGCPVICSNSSSLPEVVGDAALLFNPDYIDELQNDLEKIASSTDLRQALIAKGHAQRGLFSWKRTAKRTLEIYNSLN